MKFSRKTYLILSSVALLLLAVFLWVQGMGPGALESRDSTGSPPPQDSVNLTNSRPSRTAMREADRLLTAEGAITDVTLSTFPAKEYQHLPSPAGKPAGGLAGEAFIHVPSASRRVAMESNQLGEFPTIETRLKDTVGIRIALDNVKPGTPVRLVIMDGGSFPSTVGASQVLKAADWHGVAFEYTTSANVGTHRVLVQAVGQPSRLFNFSAYDAKDSWPAPSTFSSN